MNKSLEELRDDYIKELAEVEKKIEDTKKRLKQALQQKEMTEAHRLERLLFVHQDIKADFEFNIKQLNYYFE